MAESTYKSIFDLSDARGVTESERVLARLCHRSFLSLWSYANLHTDEGRQNGAKEFIDVLVVFGNDVVLFSDKHITFNEDKPLQVAWNRWFKRAIQQSAAQLYGAHSWVTRFPNRLFLDPQCARPIPVQLPAGDQGHYHLVAVTRGSLTACGKHFPGSIGSLQIDTSVHGNDHANAPFTVGILDARKPFIHVLDEFSLEVLLGELDTATDFITYLRDREAFLSNPARTVRAAGEEQLVSAYLTTMRGNDHAFLPDTEEAKTADLVIFDESHYKGLKSRAEYRQKKEADKESYFWDGLVEQFIKLGDPKEIHPDSTQANHETEEALRLIAAESRFRRRILVDTLKGLLSAASRTPGKRRARLLAMKEQPDPVYVFLAVPKAPSEEYDKYRRYRIALLHAYCRCMKLKFPDSTTFVGLAFDHPIKDYQGGSEDLITFVCKELSAEDRVEAEQFRKEIGILGDGLSLRELHDDEFPQATRREDVSAERAIKRQAAQKAKRKARMARASRRQNRKRQR